MVGVYTIHFLFVQEEWSPTLFSPFFHVPFSMLRTADFLWTAAAFYPHIDYFLKDALGVNVNLRDSRPAFSVGFLRKSRFGNVSTEAYKLAPLKVVCIEGEITPDVVSVLRSWTYKPVLLVEPNADITVFEDKELQIIRGHRVPTPELAKALRTTLSQATSEPGDNLLGPIKARINWAHGYYLDSLPLDSELFASMPLTRPNLLLLQRRYRGHLPAGEIAPASSLELCLLYDDLVEREYQLDAYRRNPSSTPELLKKFIENYINDPSASAFLDMVGHVEVEDPMVARNGLILDLPCVRKSSLQKGLTKRVNDRVSQIFFTAWQSPVAPISTRILPEIEQEDFELLKASWNAVEDFMGASVALYASNEQAALIRLPKCDSKLFRKFEIVRESFNRRKVIRNPRTGQSELVRDAAAFNKELKSFGEQLAGAIPNQVLEYLSKAKTGIRVLSDLPLEWLVVNGVPLNFRAKVSRIPRTPGNALLSYLSQAQFRLLLGPKEASSLLILNCLDDTDSLSTMPSLLSERFKRAGFPHTYAKAESFEAYQAALNRHKPFILIHVGHGKYDIVAAECRLQFGKDVASMNHLAEQVAIPEVVLFGACETAPIDTDRTPARAYLSFGSCAVLASLLEVIGDRTMMLFETIVGLLWTVLRTPNRRTVTWGDLVMDALNRAHFQDIISSYVDDPTTTDVRSVTREMISLFQTRYVELITDNQLDVVKAFHHGPEILVQSVAHYSSRDAQSLSRFILEDRVHWNSLLYTHYGMPENVLIGIDQSQTQTMLTSGLLS